MLISIILGLLYLSLIIESYAHFSNRDENLNQHQNQDPHLMTEPVSSEFLCRRCGNSIYRQSDHLSLHVESSIFSDAIPEPALGENGVIYRTHGHASGAPNAITPFSYASNVVYNHQPESIIRGYKQSLCACSRCSHPVGFMFEKESAILQHAQSFSAHPAAVPPVVAAPLNSKNVPDFTSENYALFRSEAKRMCISVPRGWWTYEVCPSSRVRQFHMEADGSIPADFSLGTFAGEFYDESALDLRNVKTADGQPLSSPVLSVSMDDYFGSEVFLEGQFCDETGKGRETTVDYLCCPYARSVGALATVLDVIETSVCKYRIYVCMPQVCRGYGIEWTSSSSGNTASLSASQDKLSQSTDALNAEKSTPEDPLRKKIHDFEAIREKDGGADLPYIFFLALWDDLIGDNSLEYRGLTDGSYISSVPYTRFA